MPKIPTLNPSVNVNPVSIPSPVQSPTVTDAFGGQVYAAKANLGEAISNAVSTGAKAVMAVKERNDQQRAIDAQTSFQTELQNTLFSQDEDENGIPKGILNRQLTQAQRSTLQFDSIVPKLREKYLSSVNSSQSKQEMQKYLDSHLLNAREQIIRHEADQNRKNFSNSLEANMESNVNFAGTVNDPSALNEIIKSAQQSISHGLKLSGVDPVSARNQIDELAGKMVASSINSNLESNPALAMNIVEKNADLIPEKYRVELLKKIDGKMLNDQQMSTWEVVKGFKTSTGEVDVQKSMDYVDKLQFPAERKQQIASYIHSMISVSNVELRQKKETSDREFTNELITLKSKGADYNSVLPLASKYGFDETDIANKQATILSLYENKQENFDLWINKQPETTQAAWEYAKQVLKSKYPASEEGSIPGYPEKVNLYDAAVQELKLDAIGKSPEQMRNLVNEKIKNVVISPRSFWFDKKDAGWKKDAGVRVAISEAYTELSKAYGDQLVGQARTYLRRNQLSDTPANVEQAIKALGAKK